MKDVVPEPLLGDPRVAPDDDPSRRAVDLDDLTAEVDGDPVPLDDPFEDPGELRDSERTRLWKKGPNDAFVGALTA